MYIRHAAWCLLFFLALISAGNVLAQPGGPSASPSSTAQIVSISPSVVRAGVGEECVITGTGFGPSTGVVVEVTSALTASVSYVAVPEDHVVTWTDTVVVFRVPATPTVTAGIGQVRLRLANGTVIHAPQVLTVLYGRKNVQVAASTWAPPRLTANGSSGALTFTVGRGMTDLHVKAIRRALTTWRCATGLPLDIRVESLNGCAAQDGVSTIGFDSPTCRIPNGQPVDVQTTEQTCETSQGAQAVITEVDIVLNELLNWNVDVDLAGVDQWDFETILVHAIGRAIGITLNRNSASVMTEATLRTGVTKRALDVSSDSAAGAAILHDATSGPSCGTQAIVALASGTCSISAPLAVFTTSPSTGCGSLAVRFSTTSPYIATSIQWDFDNDGIWDATSSTVDHFYSSPGQYSVRLRVSNAYGADERIATNIISVYQRPRADAGSDQTVCHGSLVTLGGASTASGTLGPYLIRWSPGRLLSDSTVGNPTVRVDGPTTFVVNVTDARGCSSSDTIVVSTTEAPVVRISGDTLVCKGQFANVRANIISGFPPFQFVWSGHTNIVGANTQTPRFQPSESTILTLQVTDARGCSTTERIAVVVSQPTAPVIRAPRGTFACQGASLPLTLIDDRATEIEWNTGQRGVSIEVTQSGTYNARSKNVAGCWSEWQSIRVTIGQAPLPEIAGRPAVCRGSSTELTAVGDYEAYRWGHGDTTATVRIEQPGRYTVRALHKTGCWSDDVAVDVAAGEQPAKPIIERTELTLRAVGGNAWQWYRNQQMIHGATDAVLHVTEIGSYAVASISSAGCEERSDAVDVAVLSVYNTLDETTSPAIVPNPASTQVAISWSHDDIVEISLRDYFGRVVTWTTVPEGSMQCVLPLMMVTSGQYVVCFADRYGRLIAPCRPLIVVR